MNRRALIITEGSVVRYAGTNGIWIKGEAKICATDRMAAFDDDLSSGTSGFRNYFLFDSMLFRDFAGRAELGLNIRGLYATLHAFELGTGRLKIVKRGFGAIDFEDIDDSAFSGSGD